MKSSQVFAVLTEASDKELSALHRAEAKREALYSEYNLSIHKALAAAAVVARLDEWETVHSMYTTAAPWKKSDIHAGLTYYLMVKNVPSWGVLVPLFETLDQLGYSSEGWTSYDDPTSYSRVFVLTIFEDDEGRVILQITATLPGDTETCKRVIVGYEPVRAIPEAQPIYELQCEEGSML